ALDPPEPSLELVDRVDALLQLVDAVTQRAEGADDLVRSGCAAESLNRLLAGTGQLFHEVLLFGLGHGPILRADQDRGAVQRPGEEFLQLGVRDSDAAVGYSFADRPRRVRAVDRD